MTCKQSQVLISRSLDGALSADDERSLADHLAQCTRCQSELEAHRRVQTLMRSLPQTAVRGSVLPEVKARLDDREARLVLLEDLERFARRFVPAAAVLLAVLTGFAIRGIAERFRDDSALEWVLASAPAEVIRPDAGVWGLEWDDESTGPAGE